MNKYSFLAFSTLLFGQVGAQSFEGNALPQDVTTTSKKSMISLSDKYYKDGKQSLLWKWYAPNSIVSFNSPDIAKSVKNFKKRAGVKLWVFNETPQSTPLVFNFVDAQGQVHYTFDFNLNFTGWRAAWISYSDMWTPDGGKTTEQPIVAMNVVSPKNISNSHIFIDRVSFENYVDRQATPDAQIPENNRHLKRDIWHWGLLHKWEQTPYDLAIPAQISPAQKAQIAQVEKRVKKMYSEKNLSEKESARLLELDQMLQISPDGTKGAPLMQKNNVRKGEDVSFIEINDYLDLNSRAYINTKNPKFKSDFIKGVKYMLNQGFAYESGMGTNHHYGYDIKEMFGALWRMEEVLKQENLWNEARKALVFWSGLAETRVPVEAKRDELCDSWNTLLTPRLTAALWADTPEEKYRNLKSLSRWISSTLKFTPGTIGGIKIDGTGFHHGGNYPAYSVPGYAGIGQYLKCVEKTDFVLDKPAYDVYKFALKSLVRYTNLRDWGLAAAGRHPFHAVYGGMSKRAVLAFAYAAVSNQELDKELAADFLRLSKGIAPSSEYTKFINLFEKQGIKPSDAPQGFYVFNYASQGIYRYQNYMVALKGFTQNIWGAELYARDNRYGRYQSYGLVQIIGTANKDGVITERASGFAEDGWDWNRAPGVTSIQLPWDILESPFAGSDMLNQPSTFAGSSRLADGKYGMFAMKLGEYDVKNFTPSFKAYKSVFCFGNQLICLGSNISNDNKEYPTQTTLFQQTAKQKFVYSQQKNRNGYMLKDATGTLYYVPKGQDLKVDLQEQVSPNDKTKKMAKGLFYSAVLNHGNAPKAQKYAYTIFLNADKSQEKKITKGKLDYQILRQDEIAHIVKDKQSGVEAYAIFEAFKDEKAQLVTEISAQTMVMLQPQNSGILMSVCNPDLDLGPYNYTTSKESGVTHRKIILKGNFELAQANEKVEVKQLAGKTEIKVACQHGIPVEFSLNEK
ncbi:chondroitinase [Ornithobacterium rhinotracheale]|uniref:chondroitinase family polysaccharide lyase n=1 Tax=Ornithobacterium rhinotracheale TaxID=28251 RepID=UPI00129C3588|nr:chondroitinase family polysaccharide lyase [Ornithobacterium rhinotracheale]MRI64286.1 chondroitinase [Ornithobacterium rhinotracheale]